MTSMTKKRWLIAGTSAALMIGLVVLVLAMGGSDPRGGTTVAAAPDANSEQNSGASSRSPRSESDTSTESSHDSGDESSSDDRDGDNDRDTSDPDQSSSGGSGGSGGSNGGGGQTSQDVDDDGVLDDIDDVIDEVVDDITDPIEEALCTDDERAAIDALVADRTDDILAEAEAAKDDLLDSLGLGGLLGGITNAIQQQLDAIDAEAEDQIDALQDTAAEALAICEDGGNALSVF